MLGPTIGMDLRIKFPAEIVIGRCVVIREDFPFMHNVITAKKKLV